MFFFRKSDPDPVFARISDPDPCGFCPDPDMIIFKKIIWVLFRQE